MPRKKRSNAAPRKKPTADASSKRQKTTSNRLRPLETPYVSLLTQRDYYFDATEEEPHAVLQLVPSNPDAALPANAGLFLQKAAMAFSTEVHDVLLGPEDILLNITLDADKVSTYYKFCQQGPITIPDSKFAFRAKPQCLDELLERYINFEILDNHMAAAGVRAELGDTTDYSMTETTESSDSDDSIAPPPKTTSQRMPLLGLKAKIQQTSQTSALEGANPEAPPRIESPLPMETTAATAELPKSAPTGLAPADNEATTSTTTIDCIPEQPAKAPPAKPSQPETRSRPRTRYSPIDFSALAIEVPPPPTHLTVLFRPAGEGTLKDCNPSKLSKELLLLGQWTALRNIRDGGIAVDYKEGTPADPILATTSLLGLPIKASLPATTTTCTGVLKGVHWELPEDEIRAETTTVPETKITEVKRMAKQGQRSWVVRVTFEGTSLPTHAYLFGRRHPVHEYRRSPLQCFKCSRYGHAARLCRSDRRCVQCSGEHEAADCPNIASPTCSNCKGPHPANSPTCPTWGFQQKVAQVKTAHNVTYKSARQAVAKAARSYSAALKGAPKPPKQPQPERAPAMKHQATQMVPNVAHPRPLPEPADATTLATLFKGLVSILSAAAASNTIAGALQQLAELFRTIAPDLDPQLFQIPA